MIEGLNKAIDLAEAQYKALVIWQTEEPFSVGADLQSMMPAFMTGNWAAIDDTVRQFQNTRCACATAWCRWWRPRKATPLAAAASSLMHCDKVVATLETYIGLVEVGVGLLPGGGGCKGICPARRAGIPVATCWPR